MTTYFSASKFGFFSDALHPQLPEDAVPISDELHRELLSNQSKGKVIVVGDDGLPTTIDPQDPSREVLQARCKNFAGRLLAATDWVMMPDVQLSNKDEFIAYRQEVRNLRVNPVSDPVWPELPRPVWESNASKE